MSGIRDHCVYEFDVEFTQTQRYRDSCDEYITIKQPNTKKTLRLIADKYIESIAEAWCKEQFKHVEEHDMKIVAIRKLDIDGFLETHIW